MAALPEDGPRSDRLLGIARQVLLDELLPLLPEERRLDVLMIANAMAIAARELAAGDVPARDALLRLAAIYGENVSDCASEEEAATMLSRLNRRLAADIRAGGFDSGPGREALVAHLKATTRARLAISNPRVLE